MKFLIPSLAALGLVAAVGTAGAQTNVSPTVNAGNLINVNVEDVAQNIANDLSIDISQVPVTVQVPVSVAAAVCGLDVNALASQKKGSGETTACDATSSSDALNKIVQKQLAKG